MTTVTKEPIRLLRVYPDRRTTYKTVPIKSSTTAGDLRDIIAKKFLLTAEEADDYVILLLIQRRPQWRNEWTPPRTTARTTSLSLTSEEGKRITSRAVTNRLRRNWDGARTLEPDENLMEIIREDRRLRWPGRPETQSLAASGNTTHHQGFDNNEFLMFIFKNGRIPLDVGNEFCGSSGEEEAGEEEEHQAPRMGAIGTTVGPTVDPTVGPTVDPTVGPTVESKQQNHNASAAGHCKRTNATERFVLGLPLDPQRRLFYQPRRPSNWNSSVNNWSPENLVDETKYGIKDEGGGSPMHPLTMATATRNGIRTNGGNGTSSGNGVSSNSAMATTTFSGGFSGYLLRRSQNQKLVWYRRWCVIRDDSLWWCKSRHNQRHIVRIPLTNIDVKISPNARKYRSMRYCFEVEINTTGRIYMFRARDSTERDLWLRALDEHIQVCHQNERVKLAEVIASDQEYRTSQLDENRLIRVTSSLAGLLQDEEARHVFSQCMCEWHCEEALYFYCDVEDWRVFAEQLAMEMNARQGMPANESEVPLRSFASTPSSSTPTAAPTAAPTAPTAPPTAPTAPPTAPSTSKIYHVRGSDITTQTEGDATHTSFRMGSGRFEASVSGLWEQREHRRELLALRTRILELWDRAQAIYDMFMNSKTAEFEVLLEIAEKKKVKEILEQYQENRKKEQPNGQNTDTSATALSSSTTSTTKSTLILPPLDLFGKVQEIVLEDMRKGAYQRLIGSKEGRRRLALMSVHDPNGNR